MVEGERETSFLIKGFVITGWSDIGGDNSHLDTVLIA